MQSRNANKLNLSETSRVHRIAPWVNDEECQRAIATFSAHLREPQRRWFSAVLAMIIGHGGIGAAAGLVSLCPETVSRGKTELADGLKGFVWNRSRAEGAGRPPTEVVQPEIENALEELAEPHIFGDPETGRKYCRRSSRNLAKDLQAQGFTVSHDTVLRLLKKKGIHFGQMSNASPESRTPSATPNST